ncbi:MAG: selenocysteine-specific translation elongation factor [Actinobacteria bacterium]|nr:selenocysteine-specific translation elongation factor [Actinomycetota bacterium]
MSHQRNLIIGTAGHIDHGKTVLVKALTGKDTDRLAEEKKRGISIDLGFAPLPLSDGSVAGIVDVPGHENFVRNMMAGATGVDLALLVVAADDGVMPQTREHLAIIEFLGVSKAVIAITKIDIVDRELLEMAEEDVTELLSGTPYRDSPIVNVSAVKGEGMSDLKKEIELQARELKLKDDKLPSRLPVDRVFTLKGIGTVITGTLWSGTINASDYLEVLPGGDSIRVRSLEVHDSKRETVFAGERVAANLASISKNEIKRGDVLASPGYLLPTYIVDANVKLLATSRTVKRGTRIRFHHGTRELLGRIYPFEGSEIAPGDETAAQIRLEAEGIVIPRDRFVIRSYSPVTTIGGGLIVDAHAPKHKNNDSMALLEFRRLQSFDPAEQLDVYLARMKKPSDVRLLSTLTGLDIETARVNIFNLCSRGKTVMLGDKEGAFLISSELFAEKETFVVTMLDEFHLKNPLQNGMLKETLKAKIFPDWENRQADYVLGIMENENKIDMEGKLVRLSGKSVSVSNKETRIMEAAVLELEANPSMPPDLKELAGKLEKDLKLIKELLAIAEEQKRVVRISQDLYFSKAAVEGFIDKLADSSGEEGVTVSDFKKMIDTTRKYAVPLLEYFDREKVTFRVGDYRIVKHNNR